MNEGLNIIVRKAHDNVGYGYALWATPDDWRRIANELEDDPYILETISDYENVVDELLEEGKIGIHYDAAQLSEVFDAIARIDGV